MSHSTACKSARDTHPHGSEDAHERTSAEQEFADALFAGLSGAEKSIPCRFLYDATGSLLFEEITRQPEYYPTRTEAGILADCAPLIANTCPAETVLIEFGSGSSLKTEILIDALGDRIATYVPLDISKTALDDAVKRLSARFPGLDIAPIVGDFARQQPLPQHVADKPHLGFFPGSTIGNLLEGEAIALLARMRDILGADGRLVIGTDLVKPTDVLIKAYDDAAGITARFNRNVLIHANRVLGTDFDSAAFEHAAVWNEAEARIEMHLVSTRKQTIHGLATPLDIASGEHLHTENSHKYTVTRFHAMAAKAGWRALDVWSDDRDYFAVHLLDAALAPASR